MIRPLDSRYQLCMTQQNIVATKRSIDNYLRLQTVENGKY
jgi:hypothetical protein